MSSLVILAAGLGSRFTGGTKQIAGIGPNGEVILDYSIYDALKIGFDKIILVIREDMVDWFNLNFKHIDNIDYVIQSVTDIPSSISFKREKPWGTAHAVYSARSKIEGPFAVINSDDYYGYSSLEKIYDFLNSKCDDDNYGMVVYPVGNTLSSVDSVNRGICNIQNEKLVSILETNINSNLISSEGKLIDKDSYCSMGLFGFPKDFINILEEKLKVFLKSSNEKTEFMIPNVLEELIDIKNINIIKTNDRWIGMTYSNEMDSVKDYFKKKIEDGTFPSKLF